ncbi:MAG: glycogen debranching enzyme family protein [Bryobacterales bacterium]|nr:glycogen debranching enzyme family protein [Bryobacterales bacterium]
MEPIAIEGQRCRQWEHSSELEWLETNAAGGFAMGTVSGANTRRYHALLVAALRPPVDRHVLLSRLEEEVLCDGDIANLGAAQYPGIVTPAGFQLLDQFRLDPFPTWIYRTPCTTLEKRLFLVPGSQTAVIAYHASSRCRLRVRPFVAFRDYHSLQHAGDHFRRHVEHHGSTLTIAPFDAPPSLFLHHNAAGFVPVGNWYYRNEYRKEMERGLDFQEDLYSPGWFDFELEPGQTAFVVATSENSPAPSLQQVRDWEHARRQSSANTPTLDSAAEQFLVHRTGSSPTIIAGYPWFTDWGRDTMISIPGLLLARGRTHLAREILRAFLTHLNQGLIPNRFPDRDEAPEYNTADATLWMFVAAWGLRGDPASQHFLQHTFYPAARQIIDWHRRGTHYNIHVDPADSLLSAGYPGTQLTWMDAKVGDWVVTPRHGKAVEINALWYNALRMTACWAAGCGDNAGAEELDRLAGRTRDSFEREFWNSSRQCLYDRIAPEGKDDRLRPNQIFAVSLPFPLMEQEQQQAIVAAVEAALLTPVGLRTLDPAHPEYQRRYEGNPWQRDGAYHQGTVWPWLLGPFIDARLNAFGPTEDNLRFCRALVAGLMSELDRGCLGSIAEIYDADPPRRPQGAPAQAWSVAELLRISQKLA